MSYQLYQLDINSSKLYNFVKENIDKLCLVSTNNKSTSHAEVQKKLKANSVVNTFVNFSTDPEWHNFYEQVLVSIHNYLEIYEIDDSAGLWLRSWPMILEGENNKIPSHSHNWDLFGYVCLGGKDCDTVFTESKDGEELYRVKNIPGQLYLGNTEVCHHVNCQKHLYEPRITIGIDVSFGCGYLPEEYNFLPIPRRQTLK